MAVGLFKYDRDINDPDSKLVLSENISSQKFYDIYWEKAVLELKIKYIRDDGEFDKTKLGDVLEELESLKKWALKNLKSENLEYMKIRIENLQKVIPQVFIEDEDSILYIF